MRPLRPFNFNTAAELFPAAIRKKKRAGFAYRRFGTAAFAVDAARAVHGSVLGQRPIRRFAETNAGADGARSGPVTQRCGALGCQSIVS